jgi:hypothetical protein
MRNDWILDVLADLRSFAQANDMPLLAEQLDDTALIAAAEFVSGNERSAIRGHVRETKESGTYPVRFGGRGHA